MGPKLMEYYTLQKKTAYHIVAGGMPSPNCLDSVDQTNPGGNPGNGGKSGSYLNYDSNYYHSGGGGGYSLLEIKDSKIQIAIAGGGAGASFKYDGGNAGGIDYTYKFDEDGNQVKCTNLSACFSKTGQRDIMRKYMARLFVKANILKMISKFISAKTF